MGTKQNKSQPKNHSQLSSQHPLAESQHLRLTCVSVALGLRIGRRMRHTQGCSSTWCQLYCQLDSHCLYARQQVAPAGEQYCGLLGHWTWPLAAQTSAEGSGQLERPSAQHQLVEHQFL